MKTGLCPIHDNNYSLYSVTCPNIHSQGLMKIILDLKNFQTTGIPLKLMADEYNYILLLI